MFQAETIEATALANVGAQAKARLLDDIIDLDHLQLEQALTEE